MKPVKKLLGYLSLIGIMSLTGCSLAKMIKMSKDQELTVTPSPLEVHADSVTFEISAKLPVKMLKKNKIYTVGTSYKYADKNLSLGDIMFKQTDFPDAKTKEPSMSKTFTFAYEEDMKRGELMVVGTAASVNGKSKSTPALPIAQGVITTSRLVKDFYYTSLADHGYNNQEELIPTTVDFYFEKGKSDLRTSEKKGERGRYFEKFISDKSAARTVTITGSHSPEGLDAINEKLAENRAEEIKKYYFTMMKRFNYKTKMDSIEFVIKSRFQDWTLFKKFLDENQTLSAQQKSEILAVIDGPGDFTEKEKQLATKKESYKILLKEIYPVLRRAQTVIMTVKPKKTDAEIALLSKGIADGTVTADTLNDEELGYGATLTPILTEKEAIYRAATKKNDSYASHNNLGAVLLQRSITENNPALVDEAITHLEMAVKRSEKPEGFANLAAARLMKKDLAAASEAITKAKGVGASGDVMKGINSMDGVIKIKKADYKSAVSVLNSGLDTSVVKFNYALAQLLNKDFAAASTAFENAISAAPSDAISYYGAAVTAARKGDLMVVTERLKKAIQLDEKMRAKALDDLEFAKIAQDPKFLDAVK